MGAEANAEVVVAYGVAIPTPLKLPARLVESEGGKRPKTETSDEDLIMDAFEAACRRVLANDDHGLVLSSFEGYDQESGKEEKVFVLEHEKSRMFRQVLYHAEARIESLNISGPPNASTQIEEDTSKVLSELNIDIDASPGWLVISTCTIFE